MMTIRVPIVSIGGDVPGMADAASLQYRLQRLLDVPAPARWPVAEDFPDKTPVKEGDDECDWH